MASGLRPVLVLLALWPLLFSCSASGAREAGGAGPAATGQGRAAPDASPALLLELRISGGFAGRDELLRLTDDGLALVLDRRRQRSRRLRIGPERQREINDLVAGLTGSADEEQRRFPASPCRDCLVYQLLLPAAGKASPLRIVSDRLAASPYRQLLAALLDLLAEGAGEQER
jgi:hypothetical protein